MRVGTKSLLFGVHCFLLHPIFLALAWNRLYGFPLSFPLWVCFFLHDIGYFGKRDMDSPEEGQTHPELGAKIVGSLFGREWSNFSLYHSRFYARACNASHSKLCCADKLAFCYYPPKLYIILARATGEMQLYKDFSEDSEGFQPGLTDLEWYYALKRYTLRVVIETNKSYYNHVDIGRRYHPRDPHTNRIL